MSKKSFDVYPISQISLHKMLILVKLQVVGIDLMQYNKKEESILLLILWRYEYFLIYKIVLKIHSPHEVFI